MGRTAEYSMAVVRSVCQPHLPAPHLLMHPWICSKLKIYVWCTYISR